MDSNDIKILEKKTVYQGYFKMEQWRYQFRQFSGDWSAPVTRELFERGHAAAVLLYDPARDEVVLIEQCRLGPIVVGENPWMIEVVAGIIDEGETADDVVIREAKEEAGVDIVSPTFINRFFATPGGSSEQVSLYWAKVDASTADGIHGLDEEQEDIKVIVWPSERAFAAVADGEINNAISIVALQWLQVNRERLRV